MDIAAVAADPAARRMGERMFVSYCAQCHGSDARGARGFPNLRDNDWLYGGQPQTIEQTILDGRNGVMPSWEAALGGEAGVSDVAEYVLSLSGRDTDAAAAKRGKVQFETICAACHGADGKGNQALGAPNLTDKIWLYGGSRKAIMETIAKGRNGHMPAHRDFLGKEKVHLLAAYVYSLSTGQAKE
jgi:cytochrome c oxidase cbb3-type subunit 3